MRTATIVVFMSMFGGVLAVAAPAMLRQQASSQTRPAANLLVGSITAIDGKLLTVKSDSGTTTTVTTSDTARILQSMPGAKTVTGATPIPITGIAVGDRVLVAIHTAPDSSATMATTVIVMKQADIAKRQQAEQADWQLHGIGGIVKTVDIAAGTLTIASQTHTVKVQTTAKTIVRRYDPASIQYSDAKPSTLDQIHPGDQLRVRGNRSPDGSEIQADEVVASSFRNIAGTVASIDSAASTLTVTDFATKKPVVIRIATDSQLHKLPAMMAHFLAMRFKNGSSGSTQGGQQAASGNPQSGNVPQNLPVSTGGKAPSGNLSQILRRTPVIQLSDLHKGDAVMIVASQGTPGSATAFTLLAGVEPILSASPGSSQNMFSAAWNLGGQGGAVPTDGAPPASR